MSPSGGLPSIPPQTRGPPASPARLRLFLLHALTLSSFRVAGDEQPPSHLLSPLHLLLVRRRGTRHQAAGVRPGTRRELPGPVEFGAARVRARRGHEGGRWGAEEGFHARGELGFGEVALRDTWYDAMLSSVNEVEYRFGIRISVWAFAVRRRGIYLFRCSCGADQPICQRLRSSGGFA